MYFLFFSETLIAKPHRPFLGQTAGIVHWKMRAVHRKYFKFFII